MDWILCPCCSLCVCVCLSPKGAGIGMANAVLRCAHILLRYEPIHITCQSCAGILVCVCAHAQMCARKDHCKIWESTGRNSQNSGDKPGQDSHCGKSTEQSLIVFRGKLDWGGTLPHALSTGSSRCLWQARISHIGKEKQHWYLWAKCSCYLVWLQNAKGNCPPHKSIMASWFAHRLGGQEYTLLPALLLNHSVALSKSLNSSGSYSDRV